MTDVIKKAAVKLQGEEQERRNEIAACLAALNTQFINSATLKSHAVASRVVPDSDRTLLVVQKGEEGDTDFGELIVGIDCDGWLMGPWDGVRNLPYREVAIDSETGRNLMDDFPTVVVKAFKIRV
jgi:hypothetical protein